MAKRYPKKINIVAVPNPHKPDGVEFHMEDKDGCVLETLVFSKDEEPGMQKGDEHELRFKLVQQKGMTLEFAQSPDRAFWVAWGSATSPPACPQSQPSARDPILYAEHSSPNNLRIVNTNPCKQFFSFAVNFVDPHSANPTKLISYDPVGENKNGGIGNFEWASASNLTIGAAVAGVAIIAIAALVWLSR